MMKKALSILLVLLMAFSAVACTAAAPAEPVAEATAAPEAAATEAATEATEAPAKVDFSQNQNVSRASDAAKNTIELHVTGIGSSISSDVKEKGDYTICVMTKNSTNPYMNGMWKGAEKAAADLGIKVVTLGPAQQDSIEEQIAIMEAQIQQGVSAFVIHPSDSMGIMPAVDAANEAGIPVISIGTASASGSMMRTGVDYYETGEVVAKYLFEMVGGEGGLIILEGPPGAQNAEERKAGITDLLASYPGITLIDSQPANFNRAQGMQVMENLLQREGVKDSLKVVIAANDEMALGAIQALKAAGITNVLVGGFDGSADASQAVKAGDLTVTYNTDPFGSTYYAIAMLVKYLDDGTLPAEYFIPFPSERHMPLIDSSNIDDYISLSAWFK
ncbi:MAG: sugar ABC transporter substrate-binding protein [Eubacteriales bacterium]|nr:sugar ABC transporter substrate-binding protein [Eubacteriales bacterium]